MRVIWSKTELLVLWSWILADFCFQYRYILISLDDKLSIDRFWESWGAELLHESVNNAALEHKIVKTNDFIFWE